MAANTSPQTLQDAILYYADLDVCQAKLVAARWPDGVECPTCGRTDVSYLANQRRWQCREKHPQKQFSVKVGTIFEDSPISLSKWFTAIWLIASAKNGISSYELHRAIGVTQKSAWFMLHRIRFAMQTKSFMKIDGEVEIDETFIGGKARNMHKSKRARLDVSMNNPMVGKAAVMGLLARHGKNGHSEVRLQVIENNRKRHVKPVIDEHVAPGATVNTDALMSYKFMSSPGAEFIHKVIDHAEKYVDGTVHTNGMENFWSLLKRSIKGTYVSVEPFHLFRYLDEHALRFNTRKMSDSARFGIALNGVVGKRVTYTALTGAQEPERH